MDVIEGVGAKPDAQIGRRFYRPELDVLRFVAFTAVFVHHMWPRDTGYYVAHHLPEPRLQAALANACGFGLPLFFFLSAFLITSLLLREKTIGGVRIGAFYVRRILRIWPLYFLGIGLGVLVMLRKPDVPLNGTPRMFAQYALLVGNWFWASGRSQWESNPFTPLWSISVEEQFYVLWPLAVAYLSRRGLWLSSAGLAVVAVVTEGLLGHWHSDTDAVIWTNSFVQFEMFAAGAGCALFYETRAFTVSWQVRAALVAMTLLCWVTASWGLQIKYIGPALSGPSLIAGYALVAIGCLTSFLAVFDLSGRLPRSLVFLGRISFGLYVFHLSAAQLVGRYAPTFVTVPDRLAPHLALDACVALPLAILMATVSYHFYERPFLRLKERFTVVPSRDETAVSAPATRP